MEKITQEFSVVSGRGRVYEGRLLRRIVLQRLRARLGKLMPLDWIARADKALTPEFLRRKNGQLPSALARDIEDYVLGLADLP